MGGEESMTVADVAELLAVPAGHVRKYISEHGLSVTKSSGVELQEMKRLGLVPINTPTANLLPKSTIQALVKIVKASFTKISTFCDKVTSDRLICGK
jgi:predicted transcriptional regulator